MVLLIIAPVVSMASIDTNLSFGSRGQAVSDLQNLLISKGFLNTSASGGFYSLTKQAVVAYQTSLGLPATGFVGPMTRAKINAEFVSETASVGTSQSTQTPPAQMQTNSTSLIVTPTINPTITSTASTQNSTSQSANTTSATPVTTPLLSFSELSPELQNIVRAQEKQVEQMAAQAQNQPVQTANKPTGTGVTQAMIDQLEQDLSRQSGSPVSLSRDLVDPSATCVEKPNLVFEPDRANGSSNVTILAIYDTGCPLNQNTNWSFSDSNGFKYDSGILSDGSWKFGKENGSDVNNVVVFSRTIQTTSNNFTMTVGSTTTQSSVAAQ